MYDILTPQVELALPFRHPCMQSGISNPTFANWICEANCENFVWAFSNVNCSESPQGTIKTRPNIRHMPMKFGEPSSVLRPL